MSFFNPGALCAGVLLFSYVSFIMIAVKHFVYDIFDEVMNGMKKERNELMEFLGGLAMLVVGLFLFTSKVTVQSALFSGSISIGSATINSGLVVIPFIIGIVMLFVRPGSIAARIVTGIGLLVIIASVIASTTVRLPRISLYEWILYLVLIFGGAGLLCRALFGGKNDKDDNGERGH